VSARDELLRYLFPVPNAGALVDAALAEREAEVNARWLAAIDYVDNSTFGAGGSISDALYLVRRRMAGGQ